MEGSASLPSAFDMNSANLQPPESTAASVGELICAVLESIDQSLSTTRAMTAQVVTQLSAGDQAVALRDLETCLAHCSQVHAALLQVMDVQGLSLQGLARTRPATAARQVHLARTLGRLKGCLQQRDYVLLADLLAGELPSALDAWDDLRQALAEHANE
jgi:hypothetical protein